MIKRSSTYDSEVFQAFNRLDKENYHSVVNFYEKNYTAVSSMIFDESFIMLLSYANALFEIEAFKRYLEVSEVVIQQSIIENIQFFNGEDIYLTTLWKKAVCYFTLHEYEKAQYIATELLKMVPKNRAYRKLLIRSELRQRPKFVKQLLAAGVGLYLLSVALIVINILIVKPIYGDLPIMETARMSIFLLAIASLLGGVFIHRIQVSMRATKIQRVAERKKKNA